ncbi:hypothetical protein KR084_012598, partial [Drosophila pseudotakahashii]
SGGDREQLRGFVAASRRRLHGLLERLGWSEGATSEPKAEEKPEVLEQLPLPASCCANPAFSLQLDGSTLQQIIGTDAGGIRSFEDLQVALSEQHRLLIYEHVLQHTAKHPEFQDNAAFAQLVGETKRERKKQRRHRKSKPTHNEELHQLVGLQMDALQRQWQREKERKRQDQEHNERSRHTGSSRKRSRS